MAMVGCNNHRSRAPLTYCKNVDLTYAKYPFRQINKQAKEGDHIDQEAISILNGFWRAKLCHEAGVVGIVVLLSVVRWFTGSQNSNREDTDFGG
ncbi:hypothetical protein BGAL_0790g00030 [Botrytis galanthina]|uniref:Uncharacterized protein n=1 Tax=Botrytis galanthina TaxID=278940 RepID=A0A4V4HT32_9HELO|nr:hypothetical protein BGAL_0790g00030 [Botrytis galanthina]